MSMKPLALAGLMSFAFGAAAMAEPLTATLAQPVAKPTKVIAGGAVWSCEGQACVSASDPPDRAQGVGGCKALAREVGQVVQFSGLSADEQAKCTGKPPVTQTAQTR